MKNLMGLIVFIFLAELCYGQTIDNLDKKRGFDIFKLDDNYGKWENSLKYERSENNGIVYKYKGYTPNMVFNTYPIDAIYLRFKAKKLVSIYILLKKLETENISERKKIFEDCNASFTDIGKRLNLLFGNPAMSKEPDKKILDAEIVWSYVAAWIAPKTSLTVKLTFMEITAVCALEIQISDNANLLEGQTNGF